MLPGIVTAAVAGAQGFDCDSVLTAATAAQLRAAGFAFCLRYLSRTSPQHGGDLSATEAGLILAAGLALMPVQHVQRAGWMPSDALGAQYGIDAAANAREVGFPPGVNIWLDLEGVLQSAGAEDTIAYCNAWAAEVDGAGYVSGLYVGPNQPLTGDQLYWRLRTRHYWRSAAIVPDVPFRGFQMFQALAPSPVAGFAIDRDVVMPDAFGGSAFWLAPR